MTRIPSLAGLIGVYEKSLPEIEDNDNSWAEVFDLAIRSGYGFFELSIDESRERLSRLDWTAHERARLRRTAAATGLRIGTLCLSAHRAHPMGSVDAETRSRSLEVAAKAIRLAADLEAPLVQLAGYFTFYEPHHATARSHFLEGLVSIAHTARQEGVRLTIENVDGRDVTRVEQAWSLIDDSSTEDVVGLYVDVGNNIGNGHDPIHELTLAWPRLDAIQLKETRPGQFRRVPFGQGLVPWARLFSFLANRKYDGPLAVEMWNDDGDPDLAHSALTWLTTKGIMATRDPRT